MIANIRPTSKAALKQQCLLIAKGDVDQAIKLYDFMIKDMEDLPMFDNIPPSTMQQIKDGAMQTFSWLNQNQDTVMNWFGMIKGIFNSPGSNAVHNTVPSVPIQPLPTINK